MKLACALALVVACTLAATGGIATAGPPDTTPPTVTCSPPPTSNTDGSVTFYSAVSVPCTASDSGSGLADPSQASFTLTATVPVGQLESKSTNSVAVCDLAGNCTQAGPYGPYRLDHDPPQVWVKAVNFDQLLDLNGNLGPQYLGYWGCSDGPFAAFESGIASCVGVPDATANATIGRHTLVAVATDKAGNVTKAVSSYIVVYSVLLLYDTSMPVAPGGTVTVALWIGDGNGADLSSPAIAVNAVAAGSSTIHGPFVYDPTLNAGQGGYRFTFTVPANTPAGRARISYRIAPEYAAVGFTRPAQYTVGIGPEIKSP